MYCTKFRISTPVMFIMTLMALLPNIMALCHNKNVNYITTIYLIITDSCYKHVYRDM